MQPGISPPPLPRPKSHAVRNSVAVAVLVIIALLFLAWSGFFGVSSQNAVSSPNVSMSNLQMSRQLLSCVIFIPPQKYWFTFSLRNTGGAAGLVTVNYAIDGSTVQSVQYTIPASFTAQETFSLSVNDCASHNPSAFIGAVVKA